MPVQRNLNPKKGEVTLALSLTHPNTTNQKPTAAPALRSQNKTKTPQAQTNKQHHRCQQAGEVTLALLFSDLSSTLSTLTKRYCTPKGAGFFFRVVRELGIVAWKPRASLLSIHGIKSLTSHHLSPRTHSHPTTPQTIDQLAHQACARTGTAPVTSACGPLSALTSPLWLASCCCSTRGASGASAAVALDV
jgi:hypothetical protein